MAALWLRAAPGFQATAAHLTLILGNANSSGVRLGDFVLEILDARVNLMKVHA